MMKRRAAVLVVTPLVVVATVAAVAFGTTSSGGGPLGRVTYQVSTTQIGTTSQTFQKVTSLGFTSAAKGPITVRFSGTGYAEDWTGPASAFVGKSYAALFVRVMVDGTVLAPGAVTFADNTGKVSLQAARAKAASFEWAGALSTSGQHTVVVQFRNLHTWDLGGLMKWSLVIDHG